MDTIIDLKVLYSDITNLLDSLNKVDISNLDEEQKLQQLYDDINLVHVRLNRSFIDIKNGYSHFDGTATETNWRKIRRIWTVIEYKLYNIKKEERESEDFQASL